MKPRHDYKPTEKSSAQDVEVLLVGYDCESGDIPVMTVAKKKGKEIELLNLIKGDMAKHLHKMLLHALSYVPPKEGTCPPEE